ncbi:hypothetical protein KEJ15_01755 [Candidatus Bathyarchaeota archaeon]|nr:hypothetical protein [Candidatus Bathyarchaeota archaeon]
MPWLIYLILILIVVWFIATQKKKQVPRGKYEPKSTRMPGSKLSEQMQYDIRLTYRKFKQLYPYSKITYQEYKLLQMRNAFKRGTSSQKNKRMVR